MAEKEAIKQEVLAALVGWEQHKKARRMASENKLGEFPPSPNRFAWLTWREFLPDCAAGCSGSYDYAKDYSPKETAAFERQVAEVFQELERSGVIVIASPYQHPDGISGFGAGMGGVPSNNYELTHRAASLADLDPEGLLAMMNIPSGFEDLRDRVESLLRTHHPFDRNIFLIMPFGSDAELSAVREQLKDELARHGYNLLRADDAEYEGGLWDNICVYMLGCSKAIALFKEVSGVQFNSNVSVEIGFTLAHRKRLLICKDAALKKLPGDIIYHLYHPVDFSDPASVIGEVKKWLGI